MHHSNAPKRYRPELLPSKAPHGPRRRHVDELTAEVSR